MPQLRCPACHESSQEEEECSNCGYFLAADHQGLLNLSGQKLLEAKIKNECWANSRLKELQVERKKAEEWQRKYEQLQNDVLQQQFVKLENKFIAKIQGLQNDLQDEKTRLNKFIQNIQDFLRNEANKRDQFQSEITSEVTQYNEYLNKLDAKVDQILSSESVKKSSIEYPANLTVEESTITPNIPRQQPNNQIDKVDYPLNQNEIDIISNYDRKGDFSQLANVKEVSETENSIEDRRNGIRTVVFRENRRQGDYWIINLSDGIYLVPKLDIKLNQSNIKALEFLFKCSGNEEINKIDYFILKKPGKVSQTNELWELKEPGILEFKTHRQGDDHEE